MQFDINVDPKNYKQKLLHLGFDLGWMIVKYCQFLGHQLKNNIVSQFYSIIYQM